MKLRFLAIQMVIPFGLVAQAEPAVSGASVPDDTLPAMSAAEKIRFRELGFVKPVGLASTAFSAAVNQWRDIPHAWGQGAEGYAKRFASAEAFGATQNTIALGFDLAMHLDPRYRRMPEAPTGSRIWNVISQTILANKDSGGRTINVPEIAGSFGAGFVSNTWQPAHYNATGDALSRAMWTMLFHTGKNAAREFLPDVIRRVKHTRNPPVDEKIASPTE